MMKVVALLLKRTPRIISLYFGNVIYLNADMFLSSTEVYSHFFDRLSWTAQNVKNS